MKGVILAGSSIMLTKIKERNGLAVRVRESSMLEIVYCETLVVPFQIGLGESLVI